MHVMYTHGRKDYHLQKGCDSLSPQRLIALSNWDAANVEMCMYRIQNEVKKV